MLKFVDPIAAYLGTWSSEICLASILLRLALSSSIGAIIGWERASKRHAAGLRTFMLACISSATAMMIDYSTTGYPVLAALAVVAVAIISSNSILFSSRSQIKGLTTSTGLWTCAMVGLSVGAGLYTISLLAGIFLLACLSLFPSLEKYLKDRSNHFEMHLELKDKLNLQDFVTTIRELGMQIDDIESNPAYINSGLAVYSVSVTIHGQELKKYKTHKEIITALRSLDYVSFIDEMS